MFTQVGELVDGGMDLVSGSCVEGWSRSAPQVLFVALVSGGASLMLLTLYLCRQDDT